jgi:SH3-like domain-containing protein
MVPVRPALLALSLLALGTGATLAQSSLAPSQGSLLPPRPAGQATPRLVPSEQPRNLAAPPARPATPPRAQPSQAQPRQPARPQAQAPATPARPQAPRANPPGQRTPTIGGATPPPNRRPVAAAAGAAAAGAAAATAATARPPEPTLPPSPAAPSTGPVTGLPLPRFASLRSDEVNMRVGPSTSYPIEWTFQRRDLPVQIIGEFQLWRRIRDPDGAEGWVHSSTLAGRRTVLVRPATQLAGAGGAALGEATLRRRPEDSAAAIARFRPGVIGRIRECAAGSAWCELQAAGHRGFLRRAEIWGVGSDEEIQ